MKKTLLLTLLTISLATPSCHLSNKYEVIDAEILKYYSTLDEEKLYNLQEVCHTTDSFNILGLALKVHLDASNKNNGISNLQYKPGSSGIRDSIISIKLYELNKNANQISQQLKLDTYIDKYRIYDCQKNFQYLDDFRYVGGGVLENYYQLSTNRNTLDMENIKERLNTDGIEASEVIFFNNPIAVRKSKHASENKAIELIIKFKSGKEIIKPI